MRVAISGIAGFIGSHLKNYLGTKADVKIVSIGRNEFRDPEVLKSIVSDCEVIVHLAAINRHEDGEVLSASNISLVELLIKACVETQSNPHIIFSSSLQESQDNPYGISKLKGQELLEDWAIHHGGRYSGLVIPNVFGPFGKPFYNSVVATFCHQITRGEIPTIQVDKEIQLIYVNELVEIIWEIIITPEFGKIKVPHKFEIYVSKLLDTILDFHDCYINQRTIPSIRSPFELALFNTYRCYLPVDIYPIRFIKHEDPRGMFVEILRNSSGGQFSFSTTKPGITRGNHFHTRKFERFAVISGEAVIKIRKVDSEEVNEYTLNGDNPAFVDIPIWHTHHIKNVGDTELTTLFWINEPYNADDPDTFFLDV